ncbi:two-component system, sensor histidine kinase RegB [Gammaproteobacteria bacterium]
MSNTESTLPNSTAINLRRLVIIRAIAIAGHSAAAWVAVVRLDLPLPLLPLSLILVGMAILSLITLWRLRLPIMVREGELLAQLTMDVAALAGLYYFTGGGTNPFVTLFLLPLAFATVALPAIYAWALAGLTTACYTALLFYFVSLPQSHVGHTYDFGLHVLGMWLGFVLAAGLIAGFAARMSATLRERDHLMAKIREREINQERVLALGILATGAAHELGTPLSTMAVLLKDLTPNKSISTEKLEVLRNQLTRCKEILASLSATTGEIRAEGGASMPLDAWLDEIIQKWLSIRPGIKVHKRFGARFGSAGGVPWIVAEQTLTQAITNILNNAADVSPEQVEVEGEWNDDELTLNIADRGPGLAPEVQTSVGEVFISTKSPDRGLGLGLFLTYTTLSRFNGTVQLMNRAGGGVLCHLTLPLTTIKVCPHDRNR